MDMGRQLKDKRVLVTGASSGLGVNFARVAARCGAHVVVAARRVHRLDELSAQLKEDGAASVLSQALDVRDEASIDVCMAACLEALGGLDVVVNNAGVATSGHAVDQTSDDYDFVLDTNLKGVWLVANATARAMMKTGSGGSIINIASVLGLRVAPGLATYNISKAGVVQMTRTLALEWARAGIRVNALAPGYFSTEINGDFLESDQGKDLLKRVPMKRKGDLSELDGAFLLLATDAGSYITGSILSVDGGHAINSV